MEPALSRRSLSSSRSGVSAPSRKHRKRTRRSDLRRVHAVVTPLPVAPTPAVAASPARPIEQERVAATALLLAVVALSCALWTVHHFSNSLQILVGQLSDLSRQQLNQQEAINDLAVVRVDLQQLQAHTTQLRTTTDRLNRDLEDLRQRLPQQASLAQLPEQLGLILNQLGDLEARMEQSSDPRRLGTLYSALMTLHERVAEINGQTELLMRRVAEGSMTEGAEEFLHSLGGPAIADDWSVNLPPASSRELAERVASSIVGEDLTVVVYPLDQEFFIRVEGFDTAEEAKGYLLSHLEKPQFTGAWLSRRD